MCICNLIYDTLTQIHLMPTLDLGLNSRHKYSRETVMSRIQVVGFFKMDKQYDRNVRFEVSTAVTMMIIIFWEITPCGS
jgi:hypothetical protein